MYSTRRTQREVGPDWRKLLCHDHQGSLFDPPLCPGPVNVQMPGLFKRRNIFCPYRIDTRPRFPGCPIREFKVNVERIQVRNKQHKSTRFKIKGRGRNSSVGLMNIRERIISKKLSSYQFWNSNGYMDFPTFLSPYPARCLGCAVTMRSDGVPRMSVVGRGKVIGL
jgi:hypothetical protein